MEHVPLPENVWFGKDGGEQPDSIESETLKKRKGKAKQSAERVCEVVFFLNGQHVQTTPDMVPPFLMDVVTDIKHGPVFGLPILACQELSYVERYTSSKRWDQVIFQTKCT